MRQQWREKWRRPSTTRWRGCGRGASPSRYRASAKRKVEASLMMSPRFAHELWMRHPASRRPIIVTCFSWPQDGTHTFAYVRIPADISEPFEQVQGACNSSGMRPSMSSAHIESLSHRRPISIRVAGDLGGCGVPSKCAHAATDPTLCRARSTGCRQLAHCAQALLRGRRSHQCRVCAPTGHCAGPHPSTPSREPDFSLHSLTSLPRRVVSSSLGAHTSISRASEDTRQCRMRLRRALLAAAQLLGVRLHPNAWLPVSGRGSGQAAGQRRPLCA